MTTREQIETVLRERFAPSHLEIHDESEGHRGHPGAAAGGGHFRIVIASTAFDGRSLLAQHRMVRDALSGLIGGAVHAVALRTIPVSTQAVKRDPGPVED